MKEHGTKHNAYYVFNVHHDELKEQNNLCLDNEDYPDNLDPCSCYSLATKACFCCLFICLLVYFGVCFYLFGVELCCL